MTTHFTEATTGYWQRILAADEVVQTTPPWRHGYPARLPDGRTLMLPIRQLLHEPDRAVASLILNQASFEVVHTLGTMLAHQLAPYSPELLVALPTLGLTLAPAVARELGHTRIVPMGYSRKFWYDEAISTPVHSITSPNPGKRLYLDPHQLPLLTGRRIVLLDDAVSTGTTVQAAWDLLESLGANIVACGVAMRQSRRWMDKLGPERSARVAGVFDSPLLQAVPEGWVLRS